jgi:hypothetical protein
MTSPIRKPFQTVGIIAALTAAMMAPASSVLAQSGQRGPTLLRDTEIEEILHHEADPIFAVAGPQSPRTCGSCSIGDPTLNAFATQGQQMGLHTGLILEAANPNELKGVIAHETGHLAGGHPIRSGELMRAGHAADAADHGPGRAGDVRRITRRRRPAAEPIRPVFRRPRRPRLQPRAGRPRRSGRRSASWRRPASPAEGLVEFFDRFRYQEVFSQDRRFPYFRSHPLSSQRIEMLRTRVAAQPSYLATPTPPPTPSTSRSCGPRSTASSTRRLSLTKYKETDTSYPARYARAIAYYQTKEPDRAIRLIDAHARRPAPQPLPLGAEGPDPVRVRPGRRGRGAAAPVRRAEARRAPAAHQPGPDPDQSRRPPRSATRASPSSSASPCWRTTIAEAWRLLALAYEARGDDGLARLATAEQYLRGRRPRRVAQVVRHPRPRAVRPLEASSGCAPPTSSWPPTPPTRTCGPWPAKARRRHVVDTRRTSAPPKTARLRSPPDASDDHRRRRRRPCSSACGQPQAATTKVDPAFGARRCGPICWPIPEVLVEAQATPCGSNRPARPSAPTASSSSATRATTC